MGRAGTVPNYGFVIDNRRCIGCHACTVACKAEHNDPIGINKTWVSYVEKGIYPHASRAFHVMRCNHCADAPCVEICPTACLITRADGIVDYDPGRCIGCKACMQACPYDALTIQPALGTATKCNYCSHRVELGREPACVVVCPAEAIVSGDLADPQSRISRLVAQQEVVVRKPEKGTRPKLFYVNGDAAALNPAANVRSEQTLWGTREPDAAELRDPRAGAAALDGARPRRSYDIAQRHAASWGWKVSAYLATKSIAAGVFLIPALLAPFASAEFMAHLLDTPVADFVGHLFHTAVPAALGALAVTGVFLVADLKRPERFLWVLLRPQWRSWLVRGAYILSGYGAFLTGWLLFAPAEGALPVLWIVLGGVLAAGSAAYSGWLFAQGKGRDLWQSALAPLHLLLQAFVAGAAFFLVLAPVGGFEALAPILGGFLVLNGVLVVLEVWGRHPTTDAEAAAKLMRSGSRGGFLWGGVLVLGHGLPLLLLVFGGVFTGSAAGLFALIGIVVYEHLWVDTPQRLAIA